jgi:hypothetical protein
MSYLYETHLHTCQSSNCGISRGREYIARYRDLGYTGIIVTDHFFRGNCAVDRNLPWRRWVDEFCRGYEDALNEGLRQGLDVFFAWEESYSGDDYLVYGLDRDWLYGHPECRSWTRRQQFEAVDKAGGCVVQAHPFRQHYYISRIILSAGCVHGVEAANAGNDEDSYDALARRYGERLGLAMTAGSDIHNADLAVEGLSYGVILEEKINTPGDYARAVRTNRIGSLRMAPGRCDFSGHERIRLPVDIRDPRDRPTGQDIWSFFQNQGTVVSR